MMIARVFALVALGLVWSGCSTTVTNLTPGALKRNPDGLYRFEAALDTRQQSLRPESIKPYVLIEEEAYPMQPGPVLKNRWETVIQIPEERTFVNYRYKFDYEYNSVPVRRLGSKLSAPYRLNIVDR